MNNGRMQKICITLLACFCVTLLTACDNKNQNANSDSKGRESVEQNNSLDVTMGGTPVYLSVLDCEDLDEKFEENAAIETLEDMLQGDKSYQKEQKELENSILDYIKEDAKSEIKNQEVYLSLHPIFSWDAMEKSVITSNPKVIFYTRDMEAAYVCNLWSDDGKHFEVNTIEPLEDLVKEFFQESPDARLIFVGNGEKSLVLKEDNHILSGDSNGDVQVKGDYFQKLDKRNLSISFQLINENTKLIKE